MKIKTQSSLKVQEKIIEIENPLVFKWVDMYRIIQKQIDKNGYLIKCNLVKSTKTKLYFNLVYLNDIKSFIEEPFDPNMQEGINCIPTNEVSCLIVPTGVGAKFGGFAGDVNPIAKLFASTSQYLLTHPNVVNGAVLSDIPGNVLYLEGFLLDQFLIGKINIMPNKNNKIGIIFDKGISEERLDYEINVLNALKAFLGCEIVGYSITEKPLIIEPAINEFGFSTGIIQNLECLIEKAWKLKELNATAIAICCAISDLELNKNYTLGHGIDPVGGIESIISRAVSSVCGLVSAHAPVLLTSEIIDYKNISPVAASEYVAKTFLPSVVSGLRYAPQIRDQKLKTRSWKSFYDIANVVVPYNAFGSAGVFFQNEYFQNVILVKENKTCLNVDPDHLNIDFKFVNSYSKLINIQKAQELGIDLNVLQRPVNKVPLL